MLMLHVSLFQNSKTNENKLLCDYNFNPLINQHFRDDNHHFSLDIISSNESRIAFKDVSEEIQSTDYLVREISTAMEEQHKGSERINESLSTMNDSTQIVLSAVNEMSEGNASILKEIQNLQTSTIDLKQNMEHMETGAEVIKNTGSSLSDISDKMTISINDIGNQVDQFQV